MANDLVRRGADSLSLPDRYERRPPARVIRAVDEASYRAAVAAARVQGAGYVTHVALAKVAQLTAEESRRIEQCPLGEPRYRVIVDTYAGLVSAEIARLGY